MVSERARHHGHDGVHELLYLRRRFCAAHDWRLPLRDARQDHRRMRRRHDTRRSDGLPVKGKAVLCDSADRMVRRLRSRELLGQHLLRRQIRQGVHVRPEVVLSYQTPTASSGKIRAKSKPFLPKIKQIFTNLHFYGQFEPYFCPKIAQTRESSKNKKRLLQHFYSFICI